MMYFTHSIKKTILFFFHFTLYQIYGWFWSEPFFSIAIFSVEPSLAGLLRRTFSGRPSPTGLLRLIFSVRPSSTKLLRRSFSDGPTPLDFLSNLLCRIFSDVLSGGPSPMDFLLLSTYITSLVHMTYML